MPAPLLTLILCLIGVPDRGLACTCVLPRGSVVSQVRDGVRRADAVFAGRVVAIRDTLVPFIPEKPRSLATNYEVHILVEQSWKGPAMDTMVVWTGSGGGDCGYPFEVGVRYLVFGERRDSSSFSAHTCSPTQKVEGAARYLRALGEPRAGSHQAAGIRPVTPNRRLKLAARVGY